MLAQLFQLCFHITQGHIPCQNTHVLKVVHLLTMTKPSCGVCPIAMGKRCIESQALFYAFNLTMLLQHISPHINLE
jgi:hypothetical protein